MPKNKLTDLKDHLFMQIERLSDNEDMKDPIMLERELKRSEAISNAARQIIEIQKTHIDTARLKIKLIESQNTNHKFNNDLLSLQQKDSDTLKKLNDGKLT